MADRFFIPSMFVSYETLRELSIRVFGDEFTLPTIPLPYTHVPFFKDVTIKGHYIATSALDKLLDAGYEVRNVMKVDGDGNLTDEAVTVPPQAEGDTAYLSVVTYQNGILAAPGVTPPTQKCTIGKNQGGPMPLSFELSLRAMAQEILGPVVKQNIVIDVPHGEPVAARQSPGYFTIHVYSSARTGGTGAQWELPEPCPKIFGVALTEDSLCRDGISTEEWDEGVSLRTPEGFSLGMFDAHNLFLYLDLVHLGNATEMAILKQAFTYVATNFARTAGPDPAEQRAKYVEVASRRHQSVLTKMRTEIEQTQTDINQSSEALGKKLFKRDKLLKDLKRAEEDSVTDTSALGREYDNILKMPFVKKVKLEGNKMVVLTDLVTIVDPRSKKEHEIGVFKMTLDLDRVMVSFLNQTRRVKSYNSQQMHHPHVFEDGNPCMGNLQESMPHLLKEFRLCDAVGLGYGYLCSVNVDDGAGRGISMWPLSEAQKAKDKEAAAAARKAEEVSPVPAV